MDDQGILGQKNPFCAFPTSHTAHKITAEALRRFVVGYQVSAFPISSIHVLELRMLPVSSRFMDLCSYLWLVCTCVYQCFFPCEEKSGMVWNSVGEILWLRVIDRTETSQWPTTKSKEQWHNVSYHCQYVMSCSLNVFLWNWLESGLSFSRV